MTDAPPTSPPPAYMSRHELADYLGVSLRTVDNWLAEERLPAIRLGRRQRSRVIFRTSDIDHWLAHEH